MPVIEIPGHGEVEFPDTMSDQEIEQVVRRLVTTAPEQVAESAPQEGGFFKSLFQAPGTGEDIGGLFGGIPGLVPVLKPASVPLAAGGGAIGEWIEQLVGEKDFDLSDILAAGARQGGLEAGGGLLLRGLARPLMGIFGLPGAKKAAIEGALRTRTMTPSGAEKAASTAGRRVEDITQQLPSFQTTSDVTGGLRDVTRRQMTGSTTPQSTARNMLTEIRQMERELPSRMPARRALEIKREAGRGFEQTQQAVGQGRVVPQDKRLREGVRRQIQAGMEARSPTSALDDILSRTRTYRPASELAGETTALNRYFKKQAARSAYPTGSLMSLATRLIPGQQTGARIGAIGLDQAGRFTPETLRLLSLLVQDESPQRRQVTP